MNTLEQNNYTTMYLQNKKFTIVCTIYAIEIILKRLPVKSPGMKMLIDGLTEKNMDQITPILKAAKSFFDLESRNQTDDGRTD